MHNSGHKTLTFNDQEPILWKVTCIANNTELNVDMNLYSESSCKKSNNLTQSHKGLLATWFNLWDHSNYVDDVRRRRSSWWAAMRWTMKRAIQSARKTWIWVRCCFWPMIFTMQFQIFCTFYLILVNKIFIGDAYYLWAQCKHHSWLKEFCKGGANLVSIRMQNFDVAESIDRWAWVLNGHKFL